LVQADSVPADSSEKFNSADEKTAKGKTSTFVIHHDRCDPSKWTIAQWKLLADFIKHGSLQYAAGLARHGMQLKLDDRLQVSGGEIEHVGWAFGRKGDFEIDTFGESLNDIVQDDLDVSEVVPIYRGQTQWAVSFAIGDEEGFVEGHEVETFDNAADAEKFVASIIDEAESQAAQSDAEVNFSNEAERADVSLNQILPTGASNKEGGKS